MPDPENNKTTVNGQRGTSKTEIKHLDRLVIGHGNAFKVVIPTQKKDSDEQQTVSDYDTLLADTLNNDTKEAKNMRKYLEEM